MIQATSPVISLKTSLLDSKQRLNGENLRSDVRPSKKLLLVRLILPSSIDVEFVDVDVEDNIDAPVGIVELLVELFDAPTTTTIGNLSLPSAFGMQQYDFVASFQLPVVGLRSTMKLPNESFDLASPFVYTQKKNLLITFTTL